MRLIKYYFDLITEDEDIFIGYSATLDMGTLKIPYSAIINTSPNYDSSEQQVLKKDSIIIKDNQLLWNSPKIDVSGSFPIDNESISENLYSDDNLSINWELFKIDSEASIKYKSKDFNGRGYVEKLTLDVGSFVMPFNLLKWGRWISDDGERNLVWIIGDGEVSIGKIWENGIQYNIDSHDDKQIIYNNEVFKLDKLSDIRSGDVVEMILDKSSFIRKLIPGRLPEIMEHKYYGFGHLDSYSGKAIYEEVNWR